MESLSRAQQSSDLGEGIGDEMADIDLIRASGMAAQRHPTALAVWRFVRSRDRASLRAAFDGMMAMTPASCTDPAHVVSSVLAWVADPVCTTCHGTGFDLIPGTPSLSATACDSCEGTGKRPTHWGPAAKDLYERLLADQRMAAAEIRRKLED